jgi:hypothetical protein
MPKVPVWFKLTLKHPTRGPIGLVSKSLKEIVVLHAAMAEEGGRELDVTAFVDLPDGK